MASETTFPVYYYGSAVLDKRHTMSMLPWIIAQVQDKGTELPMLLEITPAHTILGKTRSEKKTLFIHRLQSISKFTKRHHDPLYFSYLLRSSPEDDIHCHVFKAQEEDEVSQVFEAIHDSAQEASRESHLTLFPDLDGGRIVHHNFEVMFIGKIHNRHRKIYPSAIDEAADKYLDLEARRARGEDIDDKTRHGSGASNSSGGSGGQLELNSQNGAAKPSPGETIMAQITKLALSSLDDDMTSGDRAGDQQAEGEDGPLNMSLNLSSPRDPNKGPSERRRRPSGRNRTMLFQICASELCLISTDRKSILLDRKFKDISSCGQGARHREHFSVVFRDPQHTEGFLAYIFRCAADVVVDDIMTTLKGAFGAALEHREHRGPQSDCPTCPMTRYNNLCLSLDGKSAEEMQVLIQTHVAELEDEEDRIGLLSRLQEQSTSNYGEMNTVLMMSLLQLCEQQQLSHTHGDARNSPRHPERPAAASVIEEHLQKMKKSLSTPFETLRSRAKKKETLKKDSSMPETDDPAPSKVADGGGSSGDTTPNTATPLQSPARPTHLSNFTFGEDKQTPPQRKPRSSTMPDFLASPAREIDMVKRAILGQRKTSNTSSPADSPRKPPECVENELSETPGKGGGGAAGGGPASADHTPTYESLSARVASARVRRRSSYRQQIFSRVVTPRRKSLLDSSLVEEEGGHAHATSVIEPVRKLSPAAARALWRKAIVETRLLIRMERENKSLQARQEMVDMKRQKLDYEEMTPCLKEVSQLWDDLLTRPAAAVADTTLLSDAVRKGVPRPRRGAVWGLLCRQHALREGGGDSEELNVPYEDLLKQLTTHQHAILIDLGRTFPGHPYFSGQLGAGQLALFNLLKAYSLLDRDVGYCQGISFLAGVLLMHMAEAEAFDTLRYLMFNRHVRKQYLPDMTTLQLQLYQLSRLVHDHYRPLHEHLEDHDISPTLYAAPWFLTLFASQFPLGFVSRVFDLIFLQGIEAVFKVALVLLGNHRELLLQCDSFESTMQFLKTTLPEMGIIQMERVFNQVFELEIREQLRAYEVEYQVLQEEVVSQGDSADSDLVTRLEESNKSLKRQNMELMDELQQAHTKQRNLEYSLHALQLSHDTLQQQSQSLELERLALLQTVDKLKPLVPGGVPSALDAELGALSARTPAPNSPRSARVTRRKSAEVLGGGEASAPYPHEKRKPLDFPRPN